MTDDSRSMAGLFTRNRHLLVLTVVMILVAGASALVSLPRIEDPRITTRNATIVTPFPGATAGRVEALVSKKIEDRLRELAEIKTIESTSRSGISVVNIELQDWVGPDDNEQIFSQVRDRLDAVTSGLPPGAGTPVFDDMRGAVAYSAIFALAWRDTGTGELGILNRSAERLGDRLRSLPGSEQVVMFGVAEEEIHVDVDAVEAAAIGISPAQIAARIAAADARRTAGTLRDRSRDLPLEIRGALDSTQRIVAIPLADNGSGGLVHVGDIAQVREHWRDPPGQIALHDGRRSILVAVRTEADIRLDRWAEQARAVAAAFAADLDPAITLDTVFDQSRYTGQRLGDLAGKVWRIGLMGHSSRIENVTQCLAALDAVLADMNAPAIFGCRLADVSRLAVDNGLAARIDPGRYYHVPCHDSLEGGGEALLARLGQPATVVPHCCGEAGTLTLSRPDVASAMRARKRDAFASAFDGATDEKIVLTNCPSCLSGLGRNASMGFTARHLAEELAICVDGPKWLDTSRRWRERSRVVAI